MSPQHSSDYLYAARLAIQRGALLAYGAFSVLNVVVGLRYGGWMPWLQLVLALAMTPLLWWADRRLRANQQVRQSLRLTIACLLVAATSFSLFAPAEVPAAGVVSLSLTLLLAGLSETPRIAWLWCALTALCYVVTITWRQRYLPIDFDGNLRLAVAIYLFPLTNFVLLTFVTSDFSHRLRAMLRTSAGLQKDLQSRTVEYQKLLETMNEGFIVINQDECFEFVNEKFCEMVGLPAAEIVGRRYTDLASFDGVDLQILQQQRAFRVQKQRSTYELEVIRRDGRRTTLLVSAIPNSDVEGVYLGASCVVTDISERKAAEEALKAERTLLSQRVEERTASLQAANGALAHELVERRQAERALQAAEEEYRLLFNHVPLGLYRSSLDGRQLRANPTLVRLNGYAEEGELLAALVQGSAAWYVNPDRQDEFRRLLFEQGSVANLESEVYRGQSHERIWVTEAAVLVRDPQGNPLYYQGTVEDITSRKRIELQQEQLISELAHVAQMKDEFTASMSHELRTPLNGILNLTELLRDQIYGPVNQRQQRALNAIEESGDHLLTLINDILDLAKTEAGQSELSLAPVAVNPMCQASIKFIQPAAQKKRIRIYFTPDANVETMLADEMRLKQILINLLGNAVKFTPERGAIGLEVIAESGPEPLLHFVVWDTGVGIAANALEQIFRPFVQIDSRLARQHEGSGLGLALVRRMAELHGGTVHVESEVERGSRFTVTLPWLIPPETRQAPNADPVATAQSIGQASSIVKKGRLGQRQTPSAAAEEPLILLIANDEVTLQMIADYLSFNHYRVAVAQSGAAAISLVQTEKPALLVIDFQPISPDEPEPFGLLCAADELHPIPWIVLTTLLPTQGELNHTSADQPIYLVKPVSLQRLVEQIEEQLVAPAVGVGEAPN